MSPVYSWICLAKVGIIVASKGRVGKGLTFLFLWHKMNPLASGKLASMQKGSMLVPAVFLHGL